MGQLIRRYASSPECLEVAPLSLKNGNVAADSESGESRHVIVARPLNCPAIAMGAATG